MLKTLAIHACVKTMEDLMIALPNWAWAEELGPVILERIEKTDSEWLANRERQLELNREERKRKTAERRALDQQRRKSDRQEARQAKITEDAVDCDPPGAILMYEPETGSYKREEDTVYPKNIDAQILTGAPFESPAAYYFELALVDSLTNDASQELVLLDTSLAQPLQNYPRASSRRKVEKSLSSLLSVRQTTLINHSSSHRPHAQQDNLASSSVNFHKSGQFELDATPQQPETGTGASVATGMPIAEADLCLRPQSLPLPRPRPRPRPVPRPPNRVESEPTSLQENLTGPQAVENYPDILGRQWAGPLASHSTGSTTVFATPSQNNLGQKRAIATEDEETQVYKRIRFK
jgi:hypothetical protein